MLRGRVLANHQEFRRMRTRAQLRGKSRELSSLNVVLVKIIFVDLAALG